jgi:RHS repeat-associated protein
LVLPLPSCKFDNDKYRYGFNGKEKDKDAGEGIQDYGMRIYDNRLGKFLSLDPLSDDYPELTPYQFASNSPIVLIDYDGEEGKWYFFRFMPNGNHELVTTWDVEGPNRFFIQDGSISDAQKNNRLNAGGFYWKMYMIPSSIYTEEEFQNPNCLSWNSSSQFDKDRCDWLENGGKYSDLDWNQRFKNDIQDNPDLDILIDIIKRALLRVKVTTSIPKPSNSPGIKPVTSKPTKNTTSNTSAKPKNPNQSAKKVLRKIKRKHQTLMVKKGVQHTKIKLRKLGKS